MEKIIDKLSDPKMELLVSEDISENFFYKIKKELLEENIELKRDLRSKNNGQIEVMPLIFRDINAYSLLEKKLLFSFIAIKIKKIFDIFNRYDDSNEKKLIWVIIVFEKNKKDIATVNIYFDKDKIDYLLKKLEKYMTTKYIKKIKNRKLINIKWDNEKNKAVILVL